MLLFMNFVQQGKSMPTIHERIKSQRIKEGLSRAELAKECGVTQQAVFAWEESEAMPSFHRLQKIAFVLKATVEWLTIGIDVNVPIAANYILIRRLGTESDIGGSAVQHHQEVGDLLDDHNSFAYRRDLLAQLGLKAEWCRVFMALDDSMNLGNQMLVDLEQTKVQDRKVFLLETPAGYQVRRLYLQIDGSVRVCADKDDIPEQVAPAAAIRIVGRVVAHQGPV
jgi:transcriptional regulator with XRE-family HTH domain